MLKIRIIPTLLWKNTGLVKGVAFDSWRQIGSVLPAIKVYNTRQVDELILLDIYKDSEKRPDCLSISDFSAECFVPLTVGGGIQTFDHIKNLLRSGADKVSINSCAYKNIQIINDASKKFGAQCVVSSIDVKKDDAGSYDCYSENGKVKMNVHPVEWAKKLERAGAGEILLTSIDRDGTMLGYDTELISMVSRELSIPVIASGGAGSPLHFLEAIRAGASACAAASIFHFTEVTPIEVKSFLSNENIPVRYVDKALL